MGLTALVFANWSTRSLSTLVCQHGPCSTGGTEPTERKADSHRPSTPRGAAVQPVLQDASTAATGSTCSISAWSAAGHSHGSIGWGSRLWYSLTGQLARSRLWFVSTVPAQLEGRSRQSARLIAIAHRLYEGQQSDQSCKMPRWEQLVQLARSRPGQPPGTATARSNGAHDPGIRY